MKFNDLNGDGDKDAGDPGLSGWTIFLDTNDNGILDNGETTSVTNTNGNYEFTNLGGGTYNVREVLQDGWVQTTPVSGKYTLTITSNASLTNQDFGNFKKVSITGSLWKDLNANKIWDGEEPGLGGWEVTLSRVTPPLITLPLGGSLTTETIVPEQTIKTNTGTGAFSFTVEKSGQYRIAMGSLEGWQRTYPTDSFFDVFVNESGQVVTKDKSGKDLQFGNTPFYTISSQAKFVSSSGVNGQTSSVISLGVSTLTAEGNGGTSTVTIPDGTVITGIDGLDFDSSRLATSIPALNSILGLGTGVAADGVLQWGIPNLGLQFSNPITLNIYVGTTLNGQTLNILRSITGTSEWTDDGIVAPKTCVVANGLCSFQTTKASYFVAARTVATSANTDTSTSTSDSSSTVSNTSSSGSSSSSSSNNGGSTDAPVCGDTKPGSAPILLSWAAENPNEVILTWSKAQDPVTYYLVAYGTKPGSVEFGNPNIGGAETTSYTIKGLSGDTAYYVKVRAGNGCMPGDFSQELAVTPFGTQLTSAAEGFTQGVLGASSEKIVEKNIPQKKEANLLPSNKTERKDPQYFMYISLFVLLTSVTLFAIKRFRRSGAFY
ncbi:MAG: fibronectin type III domain-containing protein [Candidatus Levybacteria bacterium]|nr:fibronectin type III domain-containing protein [Candidatus Levybacteria bacterium]